MKTEKDTMEELECPECPACGGDSYPTTIDGVNVFRCQSCSGVHGAVKSLAEVSRIVKMEWANGEISIENTRYFDLEWPGSRVHGWYDTVSGKVTQIG